MKNIQPLSLSINLLLDYTLHLADNALILGHRNSEWTGHGPILEQDIALSNIALDLIGQARHFYQYAASLKGNGSTEDTLAYLRDVREFRNFQLVELPNGDWGQTVMRQFLFSTYQYYLYHQLQNCNDHEIASITEKAIKEVTYHIRWSGEWVIRLGDGTEESHERMQKALDLLWSFTHEFWKLSAYETAFYENFREMDYASIHEQWDQKLSTVLGEATLHIPTTPKPNDTGLGKEGNHSENLIGILSEMQSLQRTFPGCTW